MLKVKNLMKNKTVMMFVRVALAIILGYLLRCIFRKYTEGYEGKNKKQMLLLHMNGCPHCVKMMPDWEAAKKENPTDVVMNDYERSEKKGEEMSKKHNVSGFPTILLLNGENPTVYNGNRTKEGFIEAMKSL